MEYIIFYLIAIPLIVIFHEIGHALPIILFSKHEVRIYLGSTNIKKTFSVGRMHFYLKWGYFGLCEVDAKMKMTNIQRLLFSIGGPFFSLITAIFSYYLIGKISNSMMIIILNGIVIFSLMQFLITILPIKYPSWMGKYANVYSDGYKIISLIKELRHKNVD